MPVRLGAVCPHCRSGERHRLFALAIERRHLFEDVGCVVHFAPENCLRTMISRNVKNYITADMVPGRGSRVLNIEKIDLPDHFADVAIALHVLEHVDDRAALRELRRILVPGGLLITGVPIVEAWAKTYEDPAIVSEGDRALHFGAADHVRFYGRDFRDRLKEAGFSVEVFIGDGAEVVKYGLVRGDCIFLCREMSGSVA